MKISVAMTTFNGQDFICNQVNSILKQTKMPDEIVIVDDCSTDNTVALIEQFSEVNTSIEWKVLTNKKNLGWKENFAKAICNTSGDIVLLADQDDIWFERKIELMTEQFKKEPSILVLASNYVKTTRDEVMRKTRDVTYGEEELQKKEFDEFFYMLHSPGCSMAFCGKCREWFQSEYWTGKQPHDEFLWTLAKLYEGAYFYTGNLMYYVRHDKAATIDKQHTRLKRIKQLNDKLTCINTIKQILQEDEGIFEVKRKMDFCICTFNFIISRLSFLEKPGIRNFCVLLQKLKLYERKTFFLGDVCCALGRINK